MFDKSNYRRCSRCGKHFRNYQAARQHIRDYHKKRGGEVVPARQYDTEESMADLLVEAEINRAMGKPNEPWLEDMLP